MNVVQRHSAGGPNATPRPPPGPKPKAGAQRDFKGLKHGPQGRSLDEVMEAICGLLAGHAGVDEKRKAAERLSKGHPVQKRYIAEAAAEEKQLHAAAASPDAHSRLARFSAERELLFAQVANGNVVSSLEFQAAVESCVRRARISIDKLLDGWTISGLFRRIDIDGTGAISLEDWTQWGNKIKKKWGFEDSALAVERHSLQSKYGASLRVQAAEREWQQRVHRKEQSLHSQKESDVDHAKAHKTSSRMKGDDPDASAQTMLKEQFKKWDKDGNGVISKTELRELLQTLNPLFQVHDLDKMFIAIDKNGNGQIEYDEFVDWLFTIDH